jgi:hypothetical protein
MIFWLEEGLNKVVFQAIVPYGTLFTFDIKVTFLTQTNAA